MSKQQIGVVGMAVMGRNHSPHPLLLPSRRAKHIITIHDLYFLRHPEHVVAEVARDYVPLVRASAQRADAIICDSTSTMKDIVQYLKVPLEKIHVIPLGVSRQFFDEPAAEEMDRTLDKFGLDGEFICASSEKLTLGLAGPAPQVLYRQRLAERVNELGLEGRVKFLGYVSQVELNCLYRRARLMAYPSLHEGFGLPLLEAMATGCPVVSSESSSIPEVTGHAAWLVDPESTEAISVGLDGVLGDESQARRMRVLGRQQVSSFSWERTAIFLAGTL